MTCYFADLPVHLIFFFFSWAHTCAERAKLGLVPLDTIVLGLLLPGPTSGNPEANSRASAGDGSSSVKG